MLYQTEEFFIEKFIAGLALRDVNQFPYDVKAFYDGIENMKFYFDNHKANFGAASKEIELLFIKDPFQGLYSRFREAISERNGELVSFVNPSYDKCFVSLNLEDAQYLYNDDSLEIDEKIFTELLDQFCLNRDNWNCEG